MCWDKDSKDKHASQKKDLPALTLHNERSVAEKHLS